VKTAKDMRAKKLADLSTSLLEQKREQFNLRMARAQGQLTQTHELRTVRRNLARIKTVMGEKLKAGEA
jgi:large subunit ribosomal protein L29